MNEDLKSSALYRRLCPRRTAVLEKVLLLGSFALVMPAAFLPMCFNSFKNGAPILGLILAAIALFCAWFIIRAAISEAKRVRKINARMQERLQGMTLEKLQALEEEISQTEMRYKTFYLLTEYVYAPKARLLIRYADITGWKTTRHSTNHIQDSAYVDVTEAGGVTQRVDVILWRQYLQELDNFVQELNFRQKVARFR